MKTIFMPSAVAKRWMADLRSGKYTKGKGSLKVRCSYKAAEPFKIWDFDPRAGGLIEFTREPIYEHCTLGVLCEQLPRRASMAGGLPFAEELKSLGFEGVPENYYCQTELNVDYNGSIWSIAKLNDVTDLSFSEIADIIEPCIGYTDEPHKSIQHALENPLEEPCGEDTTAPAKQELQEIEEKACESKAMVVWC